MWGGGAPMGEGVKIGSPFKVSIWGFSGLALYTIHPRQNQQTFSGSRFEKWAAKKIFAPKIFDYKLFDYILITSIPLKGTHISST